ncbi:ATP/GTP-binding protein [Paenibacillus sp. NRS-1782]|uniref:AAA family ATPase n=1 Tax=unclassified Paenibacillus TaxID=185978 RepID=UPI003D2D40B3
MLIEFSVGNYLSFKEIKTFSLVSANIKEHKDTHVFQNKNLSLLKSAVLYGANASGKTNVFSALSFMKRFVLKSATGSQSHEEIDVVPFKLSTETENEPSYFEIVFFQNTTRYRYGFEVTEDKVVSEWLYHTPKVKEIELFFREGDLYSINPPYKEGKGIESKTRDNALFLSVVAQFNGLISNEVLEWFSNLFVINGVTNRQLNLTKKWLRDAATQNSIINFIKLADVSIDNLKIKPIDVDEASIPKNTPNDVKEFIMSINHDVILSNHKKYDGNNNFLGFESFHVDSSESEGTIKLIGLSAPIIDALQNGKTLFIDELDAKLHPLITRNIITMFNSVDLNPNNAQLVFATHDITHLNKKYFRRDQIWFAEKDKYGCSDLYSLVEYKLDDTKVRKDASYDKEYINGKYGAIPFVNDSYSLLEDIDGDRRSIQETEESSESSEESWK